MNLHVLHIFFFDNWSIGKLKMTNSNEWWWWCSFALEMVNHRVFERKKLVFGIGKIHVGNAYISIDQPCQLLPNLHIRQHKSRNQRTNCSSYEVDVIIYSRVLDINIFLFLFHGCTLSSFEYSFLSVFTSSSRLCCCCCNCLTSLFLTIITQFSLFLFCAYVTLDFLSLWTMYLFYLFYAHAFVFLLNVNFHHLTKTSSLHIFVVVVTHLSLLRPSFSLSLAFDDGILNNVHRWIIFSVLVGFDCPFFLFFLFSSLLSFFLSFQFDDDNHTNFSFDFKWRKIKRSSFLSLNLHQSISEVMQHLGNSVRIRTTSIRKKVDLFREESLSRW